MPLFDAGARPPRPPAPWLAPEAVIARLAPHILPRRRHRIDGVVDRRLATVTVVLEQPHDPHNGAAVLRTAEALGLLDVHVCATDGFTFSRKVTQNAHKWLNVYLHREIDACLAQLRRAGYRCLAATPPPLAERPRPLQLIRAVEFPVALLVGNEHAGLSPRAIELCQGRVNLPMYGFSESFNLSVSAALLLHEVVGARRRVLGRAGDLPPAARTRLRAAYYGRSTPHAAQLLLGSREASSG